MPPSLICADGGSTRCTPVAHRGSSCSTSIRALRHLPSGRGRGLAADVRQHPVADRPAAGAARPGMRDHRHQMRQAATAQVRLDTAKSARFSGSVPSTHRFAASMRAAGTIYPCPRRSETRSLAAKTPESGECRMGGEDMILVALSRTAKALTCAACLAIGFPCLATAADVVDIRCRNSDIIFSQASAGVEMPSSCKLGSPNCAQCSADLTSQSFTFSVASTVESSVIWFIFRRER